MTAQTAFTQAAPPITTYSVLRARVEEVLHASLARVAKAGNGQIEIIRSNATREGEGPRARVLIRFTPAHGATRAELTDAVRKGGAEFSIVVDASRQAQVTISVRSGQAKFNSPLDGVGELLTRWQRDILLEAQPTARTPAVQAYTG